MKNYTSFSTLIFIFTISIYINAQENPTHLHQTVKGRVQEDENKQPIVGCTVIINDGIKSHEAITDADGYYKAENVKAGRIDIAVQFAGFKPIYIRALELNTAKELVVNVSMEEDLINLKEMVINKSDSKEASFNRETSQRVFSMEQVNRFAGGLGDIARLATSFPGVQPGSSQLNDVIIRGNSPNGILWRINGVEVPNPNHFGDSGATGGPVSMLNTNVLAQSDFYTGAFPAGFGNALSGVFDLSMRKGNYEKTEFVGQIGFNGFEFGAEGPFSKKSRASYIVNYRYSVLDFLSGIGVDFGTGSYIPKYQDLNFSVDLPTSIGNFTLWGVGGKSAIDVADFVDVPNGNMTHNRVTRGMLGLNYQIKISDNTLLKAVLSPSYEDYYVDVDSIAPVTKESIPYYKKTSTNQKNIISVFANTKINSQHSIKEGIILTNTNFVQDELLYMRLDNQNTILPTSTINTSFQTYQPYINWKWRLNNFLTLNTGIHSNYLSLNNVNEWSVEPRAKISYELGRSLFSVAYGLHSQNPQPAWVYRNDVGQPSNVNVLEMTKSHHLVAGYSFAFTPTFSVKFEGYSQWIYNATIEQLNSSFSSLNIGSFSFVIPSYLKNGGTGQNYGIDINLEKKYTKGLYAMLNTSVYKSNYTGSDGILRSTAFDGGYVVSASGGKEIILPSNSQIVMKLLFDTKFSTAGGNRYVPINEAASVEQGTTVRDYKRAYESQFEPYFRWDARVGFKLETKKLAHEWALDLQNVTNHQNPLLKTYSPEQGMVITKYQTGLFPMFLYRVYFFTKSRR